jgi:tungstate transport system ATP-binding protein
VSLHEFTPEEARPVAASDPLIALNGASVCFGIKRAVSHVDLMVTRGERVALVGANGSGKSTLLRTMHGLLPLSEGRRALAAPAPRLAMVFQRPFMLRLSARGNVELALMLQRMPRALRRERALHALERVGLSAEAGRNGRVLSVGQQQRVALARAWAVQPDVLLLDEPTASLDPTAKREVESLIEEFAAQGITIVISSHNLGQVKRLASRVVYLEHGRVLADVSTDHFFNGPLPAEAGLFLKGELPWD